MIKRLTIGLALGSLVASGIASGGEPAYAGRSAPLQLDVSVGLSERLNLASRGLVPVTVFSTDSVNATQIDTETVRLGSGTAAARGDDGNVLARLADRNGDGRDDLVAHFAKGDLLGDGALTPGTTRLTLSGRLRDGSPVAGSDAVEPAVTLEIKFAESLAVRGSEGDLHSQRGRSLQRVREVFERHGGARELAPLVHNMTQQQLDDLTAGAEARSGEAAPNMASWYSVTLPADADAERVLAELQPLDEIVYAYPAPEPAPPPRATETPDFTDQQGYFRAAPRGIDADFSRQDSRIRGEDVTIVDLEYDWNPFHEDLQLDWTTDLGGDAFPRYSGFGDDHGTAVFGELVALNNDYGVTGGVPDAEIYGISPTERTSPTETAWRPASALAYLVGLDSGDFLSRGDVVLLEQQAVGPAGGTNYAPLEWIPSVFEAIQLLTATGVTVVETGGNGDQNLDNPAYTRNGIPWFDPDVQHSGAILVGAGDSDTHERLGFSNHGERFDLQGWGNNIVTTGYTDLYSVPENHNIRYSQTFGGTSGAGPIVTSAVVALQSYVTSTGQDPLSAPEITNLLQATGTPQGRDRVDQRIGPLPDLETALKAIEVDPPETSATLTPTRPPQSRGQYRTRVTLRADDGWGSGVQRIEYRIDEGPWKAYDGSFWVRGVFERTLDYRAIDHNGNIEETNSHTFGRERGTPPGRDAAATAAPVSLEHFGYARGRYSLLPG